ncbi:hypothetical protein KR093_009834 [Drosophila rubida]|uniref:Uncharacterized protein n=1 Tax=Drosophila rubida TaxID=30044 RepID=A0AAD4K611_9MUSC|nr:hypothetical protein KR093_009834 [Drosophila rubida]
MVRRPSKQNTEKVAIVPVVIHTDSVMPDLLGTLTEVVNQLSAVNNKKRPMAKLETPPPKRARKAQKPPENVEPTTTAAAAAATTTTTAAASRTRRNTMNARMMKGRPNIGSFPKRKSMLSQEFVRLAAALTTAEETQRASSVVPEDNP